jgi:hypothetical protein
MTGVHLSPHWSGELYVKYVMEKEERDGIWAERYLM